MPIELTCSGCGQTLRVGDEHAGKKARCPQCGAIVSVPAAETPPSGSLGPSPFDDSGGADEPVNPFSDFPEPSANPYQSPTTPVDIKTPYHYKPHRGGLILTLGILGIFCCGPLGIVAWVMGSSDLKEIRAGQMDPDGQSLTQAGMIVGIVATVLLAIGVIGNIMMFIAV